MICSWDVRGCASHLKLSLGSRFTFLLGVVGAAGRVGEGAGKGAAGRAGEDAGT